MKLKGIKNLQDENLMNEFMNHMFRKLIQDYTLENVVLGFLNPKDKIPYDRFINDLYLQETNPYSLMEAIKGGLIDDDYRIIELDKERILRCFFCSSIDRIFRFPLIKPYRENEYHLPFKINKTLNIFLTELFEAFTQITQTPVSYECFDILPDFNNREDYLQHFQKSQKLPAAILKNKIKLHGNIDSYITPLPFIPPFFIPLIEKRDEHCYLINNDIHSKQYKVALISMFRFMRPEDYKVFELKIKTWLKNDTNR